MIPAFPVYLFDLDGTLLDSALDICGSVQQVLSETEERPDVSFEFLKGYIGRHLIDLFADLYPHYSSVQIDRMIVDYRAIYLARCHTQTNLYPGVAEALSALPGRKATATTKGTPTTRAVLEQFGLIRYFDHVQGTDGIPSKPAPDVLLAALNGLAAAPPECLMVGDSAADMEAGRRAGVRICAVRAATTTATGLAVKSKLDNNTYPAGLKVSDQQMAELQLRRDKFHGDWNYSLLPRS